MNNTSDLTHSLHKDTALSKMDVVRNKRLSRTVIINEGSLFIYLFFRLIEERYRVKKSANVTICMSSEATQQDVRTPMSTSFYTIIKYFRNLKMALNI